MQWSNSTQAGFTTSDKPIRPVISTGDYGYPAVNVTAQRGDPASLLGWFERMLRTLRECPEFAVGSCTVLDPKRPTVLALRYDCPTGTVISATNLVDEPCTVDLSPQHGVTSAPLDMFANRAYEPVPDDLSAVELDGWGYRWIRLARTVGSD
jgi:maltose alpha-D-glucosyltransferase/alpha-amylase